MYSNKHNVNILTALLTHYGVSHAVVCPGSRNAPIVHNLNECPSIACHPVTDERSAAFYALGIALATKSPVVVCVTSGSALLNAAPAVAEAFYQHVPLIVVSADRPQQWIGQLDGQTMAQPGALSAVVRRTVDVPEPTTDEQRWYCNRLINEALYLATCKSGAPVHINIQLSEPLFGFDTEHLPDERYFHKPTVQPQEPVPPILPQAFYDACSPMIVIGQLPEGTVTGPTLSLLRRRYALLCEPLSNPSYDHVHIEEALTVINMLSDEPDSKSRSRRDFMPDYIIYIGDTLVSKSARKFLRESAAPSCILTPDAFDIHDPLMSLTDIVECPYKSIEPLLRKLADESSGAPRDEHDIARRLLAEKWNVLLDVCYENAEDYEPPFSQMAVVKYLEQQLTDFDTDVCVHYANSSAVRLACTYATHYVWCNRGINGIEGSLSTAAGFSLATDDMVVCVIGDLSFFYDQNALWNQNLGGNLRIVLLNNGGGGIFHRLNGLSASPAADGLVSASHSTTAQGICTQNDVGYMSARDMESMETGIVTLLTRQTHRPMLLEVFTNADTDAKALAEYFSIVRPRE